MANIQVRIQHDDFDLAAEYLRLRQENPGAGAIVTFTGLVRDFNAEGGVKSLFLEHYPAMTEKSLHRIIDQAIGRWQLSAITVIHRIGRIHAEEQIVMVAVAAAHRHDAFAVAEFVMDYLKTEAPFWKREQGEDGEQWVDGKESDQRARERWRRT